MSGKPKNIIGKKIGRLTVLENTEKRYRRMVIWLCICDCGNKIELPTMSLSSGHTKSCGCLQKDKVTKHGEFKGKGKQTTLTYESWRAMKKRCLELNSKQYKYYCDHEICDKWINSFFNFKKDMGERPKGYHLHRIDNSKGYYPNNCEWKEKSKHIKDHWQNNRRRKNEKSNN